MRIRHDTSRVISRHTDKHLKDPVHRQPQNDIHDDGTEHIEQQMDHRRPLCVLFTGQGSQNRRGTGADITSQRNVHAHIQSHQPLIRHQHHDADRNGRALDDRRQHKAQ